MRRVVGGWWIVLCFLLVGLTPGLALACGGLFCSQGQPNVPPAPVDQTGEWIVFEVGDEQVTAHVQIQYTGAADAFAWIVPVNGVPEVAESDVDDFQALASSSAMQLQMPSVPFCPGTEPSFANSDAEASGGCCGEDMTSSGVPNRGTEVENEGDSPVNVLASSTTENFQFVVLEAATSQDLVDWLQANEYNISDNMIPVMAPYVDDQLNFLAIKLLDGRSASDISPLKFTYPGTQPMIPLKLTAVAAQPHMGIQVFILSDRAYLPDNFAGIEPDMDALLIDENGATNYFEWVARVSSEASGEIFVIEYAGPNDSGVFRSHNFLTRLYTRTSPEFMTKDPVFSPAPNGYQRLAVLDFSSQVSMICNEYGSPKPIEERLPSICGFSYCGVGATCHAQGGAAHCACGTGDVAQAVTGPDGAQRVTCVPASNPFGITAEASGEGSEFDPCNDFSCGDGGACRVKSGFPTCLCDAGMLARLDDGGAITCVGITTSAPETFGPGAGAESRGSVEPLAERARQTRGLQFGLALPLLLGLSGAWLMRRR